MRVRIDRNKDDSAALFFGQRKGGI